MITAIILTKNEEAMIADCIKSVSFCEEVILIDNYSADNTTAIAKKMKAEVYLYNDKSYAKKREFGRRKAKGNWLLYLDADERITGELADNIKKIINSDKDSFDAYKIKRKNYYFGTREWPSTETFIRLFKKKSLKGWSGMIHETAQVEGEIGEIEGYINHYTHRDLASMLNKTIEWSAVEAQLRYEMHHPEMAGWRFFRVMITAFYDSFIRQKGYKAGTAGLIESIYQSYSLFITYARLWELQQSGAN